MAERTVHHGRNIKRIREIQGIKQEALALELGDDWNQKKISLLESKERIDDNLLEQVANALHVTPEAIKSFNDEVAINIVSSTLNDNAGSINNSCTLTFNPIERWLEAMDENKKLYERLLQSEREKVELLEKVLEFKK
jgi:transcriptional regulator with XRE-family HTH domain